MFTAYSQPLGVEKRLIKDEQITGGNAYVEKHSKYNELEKTVKSAKYSVKEVRLTANFHFNDRIFKALLTDEIERYPGVFLRKYLVVFVY